MTVTPIDRELVERATAILGQVPPTELERALQQVRLKVTAATDADELLKPPVRTLAEYLASEIPEAPSLVEPALVVRGEITMTVGRAGKGKTTIGLHRLLRWAAGLPMFDTLEPCTPIAPLKSLVIENEGSAGMFQRKVRTMLEATSMIPAAVVPQVAENILIWKDAGYSNFKVDRIEDFELLRRAVDEWQPEVVYLEPFRTLFRGNENESEIIEVLELLSQIGAEFGVAVMVAHHARKNPVEGGGEKMSEARGSGAIEGHVAIMEHFDMAKGGELRELSWSKSRYGDNGPPGPVRMRYDAETKFYAHVQDGEGERDLLDYMAALDGEPCFVRDAAVELEESQGRIRKTLNALVEKDLVIKGKMHSGGRGVGYRLARAGENTNGGLSIG